MKLVAELPPKLRSVVVLRYYGECTFDEIAASLEIPLGTAKSRHHKAMCKLRQNAARQDKGELKEDWTCLSKVN